MEKDVLVILMVAFGLFAIVMFVLFFVYLKKYYNSRHINEDYTKEEESPNEDDSENEVIWEGKKDETPIEKEIVSFEQEHANLKETEKKENSSFEPEDLEDFVPVKKK